MYVLCAARWPLKAIFLILGRMICWCLFYLSSHQCLFKSEVNSPSTFVNITLVRSSKWAAVHLFPAPCKQAMLSVSELTKDQLNPPKLPHLPCPVPLHPLNWTLSDQGAWRDEPPVPPPEHPAPPTPGVWCRTASPLKINHKSCPRTWPPHTAKDLKSVCPQTAERRIGSYTHCNNVIM